MSWPKEDVETLKRLDAEGLSYGLIAERMGRKEDAVRNKAGRLRHAGQLHAYRPSTFRLRPNPGSPWTTERSQELKRLIAAGYSGSQIATMLGITRNAVIGRTNRMSLTIKKAPPSKPRELRRKATPRRPKVRQLTERRVVPFRTPIPPEPMTMTVLFLDRKPHLQCAYIAEDPKAVPITELMCCGREVSRGEYCAGHWPKLTDRRVNVARLASSQHPVLEVSSLC